MANAQVSVHELFAAFEEDDLKVLQTLTAAIRNFNKENSLKKAVTRDNSRSFLDSLVHHHSIHSFDQSSLKPVPPPDRGRSTHSDSVVAAQWHSPLDVGGDQGCGNEGFVQGKGEDLDSTSVGGERRNPPDIGTDSREDDPAPRKFPGDGGLDEVGGTEPSSTQLPAEAFSVSGENQPESETSQDCHVSPPVQDGVDGEQVQTDLHSENADGKGARSVTVSSDGTDSYCNVEISASLKSDNSLHVLGDSGVVTPDRTRLDRGSIASETSDLYETSFDSAGGGGGNRVAYNCQSSITSDISDIFESESYRQGGC